MLVVLLVGVLVVVLVVIVIVVVMVDALRCLTLQHFLEKTASRPLAPARGAFKFLLTARALEHGFKNFVPLVLSLPCGHVRSRSKFLTWIIFTPDDIDRRLRWKSDNSGLDKI